MLYVLLRWTGGPRSCWQQLKCNTKFCFLLGLVMKSNPFNGEGTIDSCLVRWSTSAACASTGSSCASSRMLMTLPVSDKFLPFLQVRLGFTTVLLVIYYCVTVFSRSQVRITYESSSVRWLLSTRFVAIPNPEPPSFSHGYNAMYQWE
jgi:hypothetical protein